MARRYSASHVATRLDVILSVSLMPIKRFVSMAAGRTIDEFASASLRVLADICLRDAEFFLGCLGGACEVGAEQKHAKALNRSVIAA